MAASFAEPFWYRSLAGPSCQFSANALAALRDDAAMRARLLQAGLMLVTPPRSVFSAGFIDEWNKSIPGIPIRLPYSVAEWQAIDVAGVPRFFLLKEGKVVGQVTGWPAAGNKAELLALLDGAANQLSAPPRSRACPDRRRPGSARRAA